MGDLVASSSRGKDAAVSRGGLRTDGRPITADTFGGKVVAFDELGVSLPAGGGPLVTGAVHDDGKVRRQHGSRYYRRRIGWQAQRDRIAVVTMEQDLTPRPDGRFSSSGAWKTASVRIFPASGATKRRVGDVTADATGTTTTTSGPAEPEIPAEETSFASAHHHLRYLPAAVRGSFLKVAPSPTHFHVQAVRYGDGSDLSRHTVSALRMNDAEAVVVLASLQRDASTWQVEQVRYTLTTSTDVERR